MLYEDPQLRLLNTLDEIEDYAIISLDLSGTIESWNRGAEKIKGYTAHDIIGKNFSVFYTPGDQSDGLPASLLSLAYKDGRAYHEGWRVRRDGTTFWGAVVITASHDSNGVVTGFCKITRDLTERILNEQLIKDQLAELKQKNRELEQFVYIASHDLQEPLLTIKNFMDLAKDEFPYVFETGVELYLNVIHQSADRMSGLIRGLLDYSRLGSKAVRTEVDCMQLMEAIKEDMSASLRNSGASLTYENLPVITAFPLEIRQLFQNLISNAIKFRKTGQQGIVNVSCKQEGEYWKFSVTDNGIGIAPAFHERIFMIFQRLHPRSIYEGTGIGLANCKKIVDMHSGIIGVTSEQGQGSTFYFTIPVKYSTSR
jgi:PAS domain S-box-containing protein